MELDLSLIEINAVDDGVSLLRLEDPSDGVFPNSPVHGPTFAQPETVLDSSTFGGLRSVQFSEPVVGNNSKENVDVNVDCGGLNMDPLQMKRRKKVKGFNMRKSLAWNKAFFTEEGVLDPEELSLVTGTFNLSKGEPLTVIQEDKNKPSKSCSPHYQSPKEKLYTKSPGLGRGLSPRCDFSTRSRVSPAKEISSTHVRRLMVPAHDVNRKGERSNVCPRPQPSSSYKRPASTSASSETSKEPKLTKSLIPRPTVPRSALPKASTLSHNSDAETVRVASSSKSVAVVGKGSRVNIGAYKGSMVNTRCVKGSVTNSSGVKGIANSPSYPKHTSMNVPAKLPSPNKSKLPPRAPTHRDPQVSHARGVPCQVHQDDGVSDKPNTIPLLHKCFPNDVQRQVSHVQVGKPSGLRVPSPSLGYFGRPKQSASLGDGYYPGVRNQNMEQRSLQAPERLPSGSTSFTKASIREPLLTADSREIKSSSVASSSSQVVQTDILDERPQNHSLNFDQIGPKFPETEKCDDRVDMEALHTCDTLQDSFRSYSEPLKCNENQGKTYNSSRVELLNCLSLKACTVAQAQMQGCSDSQQITCDDQRSMFGNEQPSEDGTGVQTDHTASSPKPKFVENKGLVTASRKEVKDGSSLMVHSFSAVETECSSDHSRSLTKEKQRVLNDRDQPSVETSQHKSYDYLFQDEAAVLDVKEHNYLNDFPKDVNSNELDSTYTLKSVNPIAPVTESNTGKVINNEGQISSHEYIPGLCNVPVLGMLNGASSHMTAFETQFVVTELKALESEQNSPGNQETEDEQKSVDVRDQPSVEMVEPSQQGRFEARQGKYNQSLDECTNYEPSYQDESALLDVEIQNPLIDSPKNRTLDKLESFYMTSDETQFGVPKLDASESEPHTTGIFQLKTCNSDILPKSAVLIGEQSTFVGSEDVVKREIQMQMNSKCDLGQISKADYDEMGNDDVAVLLPHAKNDEIVQQHSSNQAKDLCEAACTVDHESLLSVSVNNGTTMMDCDEFGKPSSQSSALEKTNVLCKADASTTKTYTDSLSSDVCIYSKTCHLDCSDGQFDMPDASPYVASHSQNQNCGASVTLDDDKLVMKDTSGAENDITSNVGVEHINEDTSSELVENAAQHTSNNIGSNSKPNRVVIKTPPDVVPFSDEWLAAIEAAGEDILTLKSGAVQHSPTEKIMPEPSPWSPVKRIKHQELGPFDCTKHTRLADD